MVVRTIKTWEPVRYEFAVHFLDGELMTLGFLARKSRAGMIAFLRDFEGIGDTTMSRLPPEDWRWNGKTQRWEWPGTNAWGGFSGRTQRELRITPRTGDFPW